MSARAKWIALRLAFAVGFAVFVLAMFDVLPKIFLLVGFGLYCIAIPFWLYPKERLFPSDTPDALGAWPQMPDGNSEHPQPEMNPAISETGAASDDAEIHECPRPIASTDHHPHRGRLQMAFVATVATRLVHHRRRGG